MVVIYGLSREMNFVYFNPEWFVFAKANNGEPGISETVSIGIDIQNFLDENIQEFYVDRYKSVMNTKKPWLHEYECSSSTEFRSMMQLVYPSPNENGVIIVNSVVVQEPIEDHMTPITTIDPDHYIKRNGLLEQCVHCRQVRNIKKGSWDWVPQYVDKIPMNVKFSFCPPCKKHYSTQ